jgi:hypothetical protein
MFRKLIPFSLLLLLANCAPAPAASTPEPTAQPTQEVTAQATEAVTAISLVSTATPAESLSCDAFITQALAQVGTLCDSMGRNQACYGNQRVDVEFRPESNVTFNQEGDIVDLESVQSLRTASLNPDANEWGIAVIKAQANIPGTLPGQSVTFLLYGGIELDNASPDMSAVTLRTEASGVTCGSAPPASVVIQSPEGMEVAMVINGANISMGSTLMITVPEEDKLVVATLEGEGEVTAYGTTQKIVAGSEVELTVDEGGEVSAPPSEARPYDEENVKNAPIELLARSIEIQPPADPETLPEPVIATPIPTETDVPTETLTPTITPTRTPAPTVTARPARPTVDATPLTLPSNTPEASNTPEPRATAGGVNLRADTTTVSAGGCAVIQWDRPADAQQVYFEGQPTRSDNRQVCPTESTTYTLLVVDAAGNQTPYQITITVS